MGSMQEKLADKFHTMGLNRKQGHDAQVAILEIMEDVGVLDTRTKEQQYMDEQKWTTEQKKQLGENADNIIRETKEFIFGTEAFTPSVKNKLADMVEKQGAEFIDVMYQLKGAFGSNTGGVPTSVANLSGLPSDADLAREILAGASPQRREEIAHQRVSAGRKGTVMSSIGF